MAMSKRRTAPFFASHRKCNLNSVTLLELLIPIKNLIAHSIPLAFDF